MKPLLILYGASFVFALSCAQGVPMTMENEPSTPAPVNVVATENGGSDETDLHRTTVTVGSAPALHDLQTSRYRLRVGVGAQIGEARLRGAER